MRTLEGSVALITGASSGIGKAAAREFARLGVHVVITARRQDRLQALAAEIAAMRAGAEALVVPADLTRQKDVLALAAAAENWKGRVDILLNNAGFGRLRWLEELDLAQGIEGQIQVNLVSAIELTRALLPGMVRRRAGCILNMASVAALIAPPTYTVYSAAKFGLRGFSEALRREVRPFGISVSLICPGPVATEFGRHVERAARTEVPMAERFRIPAGSVARALVALARRPRPVMVLPGYMVPLVWINAHFPGVADFLIDRAYTRRARLLR